MHRSATKRTTKKRVEEKAGVSFFSRPRACIGLQRLHILCPMLSSFSSAIRVFALLPPWRNIVSVRRAVVTGVLHVFLGYLRLHV